MWYNSLMNILQTIFNDHYEEMLYILHPRQAVIDNVDKMINCGDPAFGGAMYACSKCGNLKFVPFLTVYFMLSAVLFFGCFQTEQIEKLCPRFFLCSTFQLYSSSQVFPDRSSERIGKTYRSFF